MKDPYKEAFDSIKDTIVKMYKMIHELATRSLNVKEYQEFVEIFNKKNSNEDLMPNERQ